MYILQHMGDTLELLFCILFFSDVAQFNLRNEGRLIITTHQVMTKGRRIKKCCFFPLTHALCLQRKMTSSNVFVTVAKKLLTINM